MRKVVLARSVGGLGNQLFIYAAARSLADANDAELYLDLRSFYRRDYFRRTPELSLFRARFQPAGALMSMDFPGGRVVRSVARRLRSSMPPGVAYLFEADGTRVDDAMLRRSLGKLTYLEGYWQSERYFEDHAIQVRADLQMHDCHDAANREFASIIRGKTTPVAVHARRLHQVPNDKLARPDPTVRALSATYYRSAMSKILRDHPDAHFFCFADFPDWFDEQFAADFPLTVVRHNAYGHPRAHEDFWLMTLCSHFVISNSSFSWWAAWLGAETDKSVIAPDLSFWSNRDSLPGTWSVLDGV